MTIDSALTKSGLSTPTDIEGVSAADLQRMTFEPPRAYVDGLLLEGLTIIGGKPKLGKSWLALGLAVAVASGGVALDNRDRQVESGRVLYLALEDGRQRLQRRLKGILGDEPWPHGLQLATAWPRFAVGGLDRLADQVRVGGFDVVVIDTLAKVRSVKSGRDSYQEDSDALGQVHDIARDRPGLAIVVIHHNRKDDHPDDYIDALSGTTGITGVVDHIAVLQRGRGEADAVLRFTSRDAEEHDLALGFSEGLWTEMGPAVEYDLSKARKAVLEAVKSLEEATLTEIAGVVHRDISLTRRMLLGLAEERLVFQDGDRGPWKPCPNSPIVQTDATEIGLLDSLDPVSEDVF